MDKIKMRKMIKLTSVILLICTSISLFAENGSKLWLRYESTTAVNVVCDRTSPTLAIARSELEKAWDGEAGATVVLTVVKDSAIIGDGFRISKNSIQANTEPGILYGVFELLRCQQTDQVTQEKISNPAYNYRILNHWDNPDGSIERGYAGGSIFWRRGQDSLVVTENDKLRWKEYARANASIGINGAVLNNVNASPSMLTKDYLEKAKAIAEVLRPYGIKIYLSIKFSSPSMLGGLSSSDPLDPEVIQWWQTKVNEIYSIIPDFGGFLVKANSEGQPGPQNYGRTHADGANMLADALKPFGGIVMWRAFVYAPDSDDRAGQAYNEFMPLDGQFRENVIIQVKNGPVDFQPREPFSPLFGAMKKTSVMPELQITMEYLGQEVHLVFLASMWEEFLNSETYQEGSGSTVARCTDGSIFPQKYTAIAGVSNIGLDTNWCGHHFAQANWYAFGRLAWNNKLTSDQLGEEWIKQTFYMPASNNSASSESSTEWTENFLIPIKEMMLQSREAAVNYMMPLGLHHIFAGYDHYGPGPWYAPKGLRADWTPPYYHQADTNGIGFDRTLKGSNAVSQYHEPLRSQFNDVNTCPEIYLLWFHHLPWDYKMKSGRTLWDELCYHYEAGFQKVHEFRKIWDAAKPFLDSDRFAEVQKKLNEQYLNAQLWKDGCLLYFQQFSRRAIPKDIEPPVHNLEGIVSGDHPEI
ncbi:MAG: alpha-glucuronidase [Bacteroidales bacterium]|nr:alpha-glucuronidase [Bacteroidales bacterium]